MPSPSVPNGYAVVSCVFQCDGVTRNPTITLGLRIEALTTAPAINSVWRSAIASSGDIFAAANMPTTLAITETRVLAQLAGQLVSDVDVTPVQGTSSTAPPPINTAVLVNKNTGFAGRKYRGRMFTPPTIAETAVSAAGTIAGATVTALDAFWSSARGTLVSADMIPVIIHGDGSTPTEIVSLTVSERIGTIGRRLRR